MLDGLTRPFKELPPKHFYDARGAELFDRICELPEYYPTRAERAILEARSAEIVERHRRRRARRARLGHGGQDAAAAARDGRRGHAAPLRPARRDRVDGARVRRRARRRVPGPARARHRRRLRAPPRPRPRSPTARASSPSSAARSATSRPARGGASCARIAKLLRPGVDHLLLGTDLVKDPAVLEAAYDDSAGVTAEFNRNVLRVINRELDADFDVDAFEHVAFFDREREWIEMRLRAAARGWTCTSASSASTSRFAAARGAAHRDQREVHARAPGRPTSRPPAWSCATSSPTPTSSSPCRSAPAQGDDGPQPRALATGADDGQRPVEGARRGPTARAAPSPRRARRRRRRRRSPRPRALHWRPSP